MSRYLQVAVGDGRYLLDLDHVREIAETPPRPGKLFVWQGEEAPIVDLRRFFHQSDVGAGSCVLVSQVGGSVAALVVDRVAGLIEISDREFQPVPPIGPAGALIDAVWGRPSDARPMLRLRGERAVSEGTDDSG